MLSQSLNRATVGKQCAFGGASIISLSTFSDTFGQSCSVNIGCFVDIGRTQNFKCRLSCSGHGSSQTRQKPSAAQQNLASGEMFYSIEHHMAIEHFTMWPALLQNWIFTFTEFQFKQPRATDDYCIRQYRDIEVEIN